MLCKYPFYLIAQGIIERTIFNFYFNLRLAGSENAQCSYNMTITKWQIRSFQKLIRTSHSDLESDLLLSVMVGKYQKLIFIELYEKENGNNAQVPSSTTKKILKHSFKMY